MNSYIKLLNKNNGGNVFILGAGPSLFFNMKNPFFKELKKYGKIICVNSSILAEKNPYCWISNDALCRRWDWWNDVKKSKAIKIVRNSWEKYKEELEGFLFFEPRPTPEDVINPEDIGLSYCSSIPSSIDLSIQMGFKKIFILGLDHTDYKGKKHFWEFLEVRPKSISPAHGSWNQRKEVFNLNIKAFKALKKFADRKNVKIYNLNYISEKNKYITKVEVFKKIKMDDIKNIYQDK